MKNLSCFIICSFIVFSFLIACKKLGTPDPVPPPPPPPPTQPLPFVDVQVTASLQGRVLDENNKPVANATVRSGTNTAVTDINGMFIFNNIQLGKTAGTVSVEKDGYFKGSRTIMTNAGNLHYVEIQLIPKTNRGNFASSSGGDILIENGSSINFAANSIINTATQSSYPGTVNVKAAYLDPSDIRLPLIMPGNLMGLDSNNSLKQLQTYGMITVALEGAAGEKLNLADGKTATITFPIPAGMLSSAPETIPLWYFNDTTGLWKQQGIATKQGSNYTGTVSHFSFWNCDVPNTYINLKMLLKNQNGDTLKNQNVKLTNTANNASSWGYTDMSGVVSGAVPPDAALQMEVYNKCGNVVDSKNIGPFSSSTDLGVVTINIPSLFEATISGTAIACSNAPVTNGYADIFLNGAYYRTRVTDGNFSFTVIICDTSSASIIVTNADGGQQSSPVNLTVYPGDNTVNAVTACGISTEQYINYTINGTDSISFSFPADTGFYATRRSTTTTIGAKRKSGNSYTSFSFTGDSTAGTYPMDYLNLLSESYNVILKDAATVAISEYGSKGEYIKGSFSGVLIDSAGTRTYNANVVFRVRR